jgi:hypothetical protein
VPEDHRDRLGVKAVPIQLPIGSEAALKGIVDLVRMKAVVWDDDGLGAKFHDEEIPADMAEAAAVARNYLVENAVELDDEAMGAYLDGEEPSEEVLKRCIRKGGAQLQLLSDPRGFGVQEQGRAAAARRGGGLPAVAGRHPAHQGHRLQDRGRGRAPRFDDEPCRCWRSRSWTTRSSVR